MRIGLTPVILLWLGHSVVLCAIVKIKEPWAFGAWKEIVLKLVMVDLSHGPLLGEELRPLRVPPLAGFGDGLRFWT
jgi:hypothetical protein